MTNRKKPEYIILHWTAGGYVPNAEDFKHYQMLIDGDGNKIPNLEVGDGANCAGMNSITYNISCCGGLPSTPLKKKQCEAMFEVAADVVNKYNLSINDVYTHYEIGLLAKNYQNGRLPNITKCLPYNSYLKNNIGKIDITILPPEYKAEEATCGDIIRSKIKWYVLNKTVKLT